MSGKWMQESEDVHHYFNRAAEADDDAGRVHLAGDAMVVRIKIGLFEPDGLWFAVALGDGSFFAKDPPAGTPDCGNFCLLGDAKKWVEERLVVRPK